MLIIITFSIIIRFQGAREFLSDEIFGFDKELGIIALLPNLKSAKLVIPGRPHPLPFLHDSPEYRKIKLHQNPARKPTTRFVVQYYLYGQPAHRVVIFFKIWYIL